MSKKDRIKDLERKMEQLEKDLKIQKWTIDSLLKLQTMGVTGANAVKPFEPVKLESSPVCKCEMRCNK